MYCSNCAKPLGEGQARCPGCGQLTHTARLKFYVALTWICSLWMLYIAWPKLVPIILTFMAILGDDLPLYMRVQVYMATFVAAFGYVVLALVIAAVWLLYAGRRRLLRVVRWDILPEVLAGLVTIGALIIIADNALRMNSVVGRTVDSLEKLFVKSAEYSLIGLETVFELSAELSALDSIQRLHVAQGRHRHAHPETGFTCDLEALGALARRNDPAAPLDPVFSGTDRNYRFILSGCVGTPVAKYQVEVRPVTGVGPTKPIFCSDERGEIYFSLGGAIGQCISGRVSWY